MSNNTHGSLTVRVDPNEMLRYVQRFMTLQKWGEDTAVARAAQLRWSALNRAFGDARVSTWTTLQRPDQIHVPAALIAAAGVAKLTMAEDEVVFDIPTLLDATLEFQPPAGQA